MNAKSELAGIPGDGQPAGWWGMTALIDVHGCDQAALRSKRTTRRFMAALVKEIGMKAYGGPRIRRYGTLAAAIAAVGLRVRWRAVVKRFGEGAIHGISAVQLIYTSSIDWHSGGDNTEEGYADIFSCKQFDPEVAARVIEKWFGGTAAVREVTHRGIAA